MLGITTGGGMRRCKNQSATCTISKISNFNKKLVLDKEDTGATTHQLSTSFRSFPIMATAPLLFG